MKKALKIIAVVYLAALAVMLVCVPVGVIMLIIKISGELAGLSWLTCLMPFIIAIAAVPFFVASKMIIDEKGGAGIGRKN
jgi:hypothetical protein